MSNVTAAVQLYRKDIDQATTMIRQLCREWHERRGLWRSYPLLSSLAQAVRRSGAEEVEVWAVRWAGPATTVRPLGSAAASERPLATTPLAPDFAAGMKAREPVLHAVLPPGADDQPPAERLALPVSDDGVELDYFIVVTSRAPSPDMLRPSLAA